MTSGTPAALAAWASVSLSPIITTRAGSPPSRAMVSSGHDTGFLGGVSARTAPKCVLRPRGISKACDSRSGLLVQAPSLWPCAWSVTSASRAPGKGTNSSAMLRSASGRHRTGPPAARPRRARRKGEAALHQHAGAAPDHVRHLGDRHGSALVQCQYGIHGPAKVGGREAGVRSESKPGPGLHGAGYAAKRRSREAQSVRLTGPIWG